MNQSVYGKSSLLILTETWLSGSTPYANVGPPGSTDRDTEASRKNKGGGLIIYVNLRWCNPGHVFVKVVLCLVELGC